MQGLDAVLLTLAVGFLLVPALQLKLECQLLNVLSRYFKVQTVPNNLLFVCMGCCRFDQGLTISHDMLLLACEPM